MCVVTSDTIAMTPSMTPSIAMTPSQHPIEPKSTVAYMQHSCLQLPA